MDNFSVKGILNQYYSAPESSVSLPFYQSKALKKYHACRTDKLGGHAQYCENGHLNGVWYNSCKSRGCPQCQNLATEEWLQNTQRLLLNCPHHHIIFTIPSELHSLWRFNRALMSDLLFRSSLDTLKVFSSDARYLKATPGMLSTLHTWGRDLSLHPHLHVLISHGGLNHEGEWVKPKKQRLFPQKPVMMVFRGKLLASLKSHLESGALVLPPDSDDCKAKTLFHFLGRKSWVVHFCPRYDHAVGVAKYLARYVKRGPCKNSQFKAAKPGDVRFQYKSHQTGRIEVLQLRIGDFIKRLSEHIAIPRKPSVRYGGLYVSSVRSQLNKARACLGQKAVEIRIKTHWPDYLERLGQRPKCNECGLALFHRDMASIQRTSC